MRKDRKRRRVNPNPKLSESDIRKVRGPSQNQKWPKWEYIVREEVLT
jgi:hypothetical protein